LFFFASTVSLKAQEIIFCYDVDEHDGKCKPQDIRTEWKLDNGQISFFCILKFPEAPKYPKLFIRMYRNGDKSKVFFRDDITSYEPGSNCVRHNLVFTKKGDYQVDIIDEDDKVIMSGNTIVKGGHGLSDL
jgi:hypothetical protein